MDGEEENKRKRKGARCANARTRTHARTREATRIYFTSTAKRRYAKFAKEREDDIGARTVRDAQEELCDVYENCKTRFCATLRYVGKKKDGA